MQCLGQKNVIDSGSAVVSKKLQPKESNLIFVDSLVLREDLLHFDKINQFIKRNSDSLNSFFVWRCNFFLFKNRLAVTHTRIRNEFDSIVFSFIYDNFLNYQFKEKKKKQSQVYPYELDLVIILTIDEKTIYIGISESYKMNFFEKKYFFKEFL